MKYEVLWYELGCDDPKTKEFNTKKQAMTFYESIKNDDNKDNFWVTKRDKDWNVVEDIIY